MKYRYCGIGVAAAVLMLCLAASAGAVPYCKVKTFTINDGLAANSISEVACSSDGMIWVATWNGLCNYDGYCFNKFRDDAGYRSRVLTSNRIKFIRPDACGDIWCATYDGSVCLFDRLTCKYIDVSKIIGRMCKGFSTRNIFSLGNGKAWIVGTGFISFRVDEKLVKEGKGITMIDARKAPYNGYIRKVVLDGSGNEWVFTEKSSVVYGGKAVLPYDFEFLCSFGESCFLASRSGKSGLFRQGKRRKVRLLRLPGGVKRINGMLEADSRTLALATDKGVVILDVRTLSSRLVSIQRPSQPEAEVTQIFKDSKSRIWAFGTGCGVTLIEDGGGKVTHLQSEADGFTGTRSDSPMFHEDGNNKVWTIPKGGVFSYYDEAGKRLVPYNISSGNGSPVSVSTVVKYNKDRQGNLWVIGNHNLTLIVFRRKKFFSMRTPSGSDVRALLYDRNGNVWIGSRDGYVCIYDRLRRFVGYVSRDGNITPRPSRLSAKGIYAMHETRDNRIWIGTRGEGIIVLEPGRGRPEVRLLLHDDADKWSLSDNNVYDFMEDSSGRLWVATYGGWLNLVRTGKHGRVTFVNKNNILEKPSSDGLYRVRRIEASRGGAMVAATTGGLVTFDSRKAGSGRMKYHYTLYRKNGNTSLYAPDVMYVYLRKSSGELYVSTMGGGLQMTAEKNLLRDNLPLKRVKGINTGEGMVLSATEDSEGNLWFVREGSIDKLDAEAGTCEVYGRDDCAGSFEFSESRPKLSHVTGEMKLGMTDGFLSFRASGMKRSGFKPSIVFCGVRYQGDQRITPMLGKGVLDIPAGKRNTTIYFAALDYSGSSMIRYAYKIKELDSGWNYVEAEHSMSLNHIKAGRYTLVVRSTNSDGVWTDNGTELKIYVHPEFWETGWASAIYIITAICLLYSCFYVWKLRNRAAVEKIMKERQREFFTDISHRLRTPLTLIAGPIRQVIGTEKLSEKGRAYLEIIKRNSDTMLHLVNKALDLPTERDESHLKSDGESRQDLTYGTVEKSVLTDESADVATRDMQVTILVVEDNDELRFFLTDCLGRKYNVIEARNGLEGLELAESRMPDFILTDIMMPVMDGMTMVRKIKADNDICHIPIIVLSARTAMEYRIEGLNEGIDDYMTKPFSVEYLESRVENIILQRRRLQRIYADKMSGTVNAGPSEDSGIPVYSDRDNEFVRLLKEYVNDRISNPDMKMDDIARATGVSRTVFYGKVKSMFGMSPIDFVRSIRLSKAMEMIAESDMPLSEIAYTVGFSDPKYFGRTFKSKTGMSPSEYRKKYAKGADGTQKPARPL